MEEKKHDKEYYAATQGALNSYDTKLWAIPAIFMGTAGYIASNHTNLLVLVIGFLFLVVLMLQFYKTHIFHLLLQEKINEFDDEWNKANPIVRRIPTESMPAKDLWDRMDGLEKKGMSFTAIQKKIVGQTVSGLAKQLMWIVITLVFCLLIKEATKLILIFLC